jgi:hypothetical protein
MKIPTHANHLAIIPLALPLLLAGTTQVRASIILQEDFETDGLGSRYTATSAFSDGADDYFILAGMDDGPSGLPPYSGFGGSYFWAAEDVDGPLNPTGLALLDFSGIELTGVGAIRISLDIAAGSIVTFDRSGDHVHVMFRVDGGPWTTALAFENDGSTFNSSLHQDLDFDGVGEGPILGFAFQTFASAAFPVAGALMDLRIDTDMNSGGEAVAFDNITVTAVPEPAAAGVLILLVALLYPLRRHFLPRWENESRA